MMMRNPQSLDAINSIIIRAIVKYFQTVIHITAFRVGGTLSGLFKRGIPGLLCSFFVGVYILGMEESGDEERARG